MNFRVADAITDSSVWFTDDERKPGQTFRVDLQVSDLGGNATP